MTAPSTHPAPEWRSLARPEATIEWCRWPSTRATPVGQMLIAHGASEHAARYSRLAEQLNAAGWEVFGIDHRGHGRTAAHHGEPGVARPGGWDAMVDDIIAVADLASGRSGADHASNRAPTVPFVLFGHSMGSLLAQRVCQLAGDRFAGVVLSGTSGGLEGADDLDAMLRAIEQAEGPSEPSAMFAGMFAGFNEPFAGTTDAPTGYEWLSRDEDEVAAYVADPWCGGDLSNGFVTDMITGMATMWAPGAEDAVPRSLPVLLMAGDQDPVGDFGESVRALHDRYNRADIAGSELLLYDDARHELLNETNRDEIHRDLLGWCERIVGG